MVEQVAGAHEGVEVTSPPGPDGGTRDTLWFRTRGAGGVRRHRSP
ncbi:MAG TPA: hypothetical protein VFI47_13495 [Acidimicrobiales bacterium]|nr:hypothetical protein [Acidimicrobiales bacterium]